MNSFKLTYPACTVRAPIILTFVGCVAVPYLSALSHKRHAFRGGGGGKLLNIKCVLVFSTIFV